MRHVACYAGGMAATMTRLDEIREQLAPDQLAFLAERVLCRTDKEAAANLNFGYSTVLSWPEKPIINEAVRLILADGVDVAREILRRGLTDAARVKVGGLRGKNKMLQQAAATEILDRFLGKPTQAINATVTADIAVKGYMVVSPDDWDEPDSGLSASTVAGGAVA